MTDRHDGAEKWALRPRGRVNYKEEELDPKLIREVPYLALSAKIRDGEFNPPHPAIPARSLSLEALKKDGFQTPVWVQGSEAAGSSAQELGMELPPGGLTAGSVAEAVGLETRLHTINVATQRPGPRLTLGAWMDYFKQPAAERKNLLNVVSLSLVGSPLEAQIKPACVVRQLNLVDQVWPKKAESPEEARPEVLLYSLMSPQGAFTDFHVDFGGSSVWYHIISGSKIFLLVPPTPENMSRYETWASSKDQANMFYAEGLQGTMKYELKAGDTLLIPAGWPHAVVTPQDSLVVGGNFLHALDFRRQMEVHAMEDRLEVEQAARFPLFRQLMWHSATHFHSRISSPSDQTSLCKWELRGLPHLIKALRRWLLEDRSGAAIPPEIKDPAGLLDKLSVACPESEPGDQEPTTSDQVGPTFEPGLDSQDGQTSFAMDEDLEGVLDGWDTGIPEDFDSGLSFNDDDLELHSAALMAKYFPPDFDTDLPSCSLAPSACGNPIRGHGMDASNSGALIPQSSLCNPPKGLNVRPSKLEAASSSRKDPRLQAKARNPLALTKPGMKKSESVRPLPKDLVRLGRNAQAERIQKPKADNPMNPAAVSRARIEHLKSELKKEQMLQARLVRSNLPLKDGGAKVTTRISQLRSKIANIEGSIPQQPAGLRQVSETLGKMIPIQNGASKVVEERGEGAAKDTSTGKSTPQEAEAHLKTPSSVKPPMSGKKRPSPAAQSRNINVPAKKRPALHPAMVPDLGRKLSLAEEREKEKRHQERLRAKRKQEAEMWEKRRKDLNNMALAQQMEVASGLAEEDGGMWTCLSLAGKPVGPCTVAKLCHHLLQETVSNSTMVNDEEEGVTIRLGTLLAQPLNRAKLVAAQISHNWAPAQTPPVPSDLPQQKESCGEGNESNGLRDSPNNKEDSHKPAAKNSSPKAEQNDAETEETEDDMIPPPPPPLEDRNGSYDDSYQPPSQSFNPEPKVPEVAVGYNDYSNGGAASHFAQPEEGRNLPPPQSAPPSSFVQARHEPERASQQEWERKWHPAPVDSTQDGLGQSMPGIVADYSPPNSGNFYPRENHSMESRQPGSQLQEPVHWDAGAVHGQALPNGNTDQQFSSHVPGQVYQPLRTLHSQNNQAQPQPQPVWQSSYVQGPAEVNRWAAERPAQLPGRLEGQLAQRENAGAMGVPGGGRPYPLPGQLEPLQPTTQNHSHVAEHGRFSGRTEDWEATRLPQSFQPDMSNGNRQGQYFFQQDVRGGRGQVSAMSPPGLEQDPIPAPSMPPGLTNAREDTQPPTGHQQDEGIQQSLLRQDITFDSLNQILAAVKTTGTPQRSRPGFENPQIPGVTDFQPDPRPEDEGRDVPPSGRNQQHDPHGQYSEQQARPVHVPDHQAVTGFVQSPPPHEQWGPRYHTAEESSQRQAAPQRYNQQSAQSSGWSAGGIRNERQALPSAATDSLRQNSEHNTQQAWEDQVEWNMPDRTPNTETHHQAWRNPSPQHSWEHMPQTHPRQERMEPMSTGDFGFRDTFAHAGRQNPRFSMSEHMVSNAAHLTGYRHHREPMRLQPQIDPAFSHTW